MSFKEKLNSFFILILCFLFIQTISYSQNNNDEVAQELVLASDGVAHYVIYYSSSESEIVEHAALELGQWLEEISGANFPTTTDDSNVQDKIIIGKNNPFAQAISDQLDFNSIHDDGFRIYTYNGDVYIVGNIDRGTLYGVYYLLDAYYGVRWFSPEFDYVPQQSTLTISDDTNDLQNPRFQYREIFNGDTDDPYFRQHNRLNGSRGDTHRSTMDYPSEINTWSKDGPSGGHNFHDIISETYWYGGQILTMEEGTRSEAADYFTNKITNEGDSTWYMFAQEDNGWEPDGDSQSFADGHGGKLSAPIADMLIDVANRVRQTHSEAHLATSAYQWSFDAPTGMTIPEYVMIEVSPIEANFGYPYSNVTKNEQANNAFTSWDQISSSLAVWDYNANFQNYLQPLPNIKPMCENIQYLADINSIKSYFGEGSYNTQGAEFAELRAWVAARLLWDPYQDYQTLIDEFCDGYYGPASTYIKQYIDLMHQSVIDTDDRIAAKQRITSDYLNLDFIRQADDLMANAEAAATGEYLSHVHDVRLGVDMTILLREHLYKADAEARGEIWTEDPNRRARFDQYSADANIENYNEDSPIQVLYDAMDIERVVPPDPDIVSENDEWIDFQDLDFWICCGVTYTEDQLASDHGAVKYIGPEWAIQLKLDLLPPDGEWTFYAYVKADVKPGADPNAEAFNMGVEPGSWISPTVAEVQDGEYHVFEFPEMPVVYQTGKDVWLSPEEETINNLYVDRIVAIKKKTVLLQTKIFLEGAYNSNTGQMSTALHSDLPLTSPYSEDARTVNSISVDVVDWILVQLRETATGTAITSKSAFLHKDGRIVTDDGTSGEIELNAPAGNYYIVIKHRNHLAVMSKNAISLNSTSSTLYDFTTGSEQFYGTGGAKQLGN